MKKSIPGILDSLFFFIPCKKNNPKTFINQPVATLVTTQAFGSFISNSKITSGTVRILKDAANKVYLVFENFNIESGRDPKNRISTNNNGSPSLELDFLKVTAGNFSYELEVPFNYTRTNHVLTWCSQFAVLFGYAVFI